MPITFEQALAQVDESIKRGAISIRSTSLLGYRVWWIERSSWIHCSSISRDSLGDVPVGLIGPFAGVRGAREYLADEFVRQSDKP